MLSKRYKSTEVDRRTWLHVPSGTPWSTSSDTHQVVEIHKRDFYSDVYTILNRIKFMIWQNKNCKQTLASIVNKLL